MSLSLSLQHTSFGRGGGGGTQSGKGRYNVLILKAALGQHFKPIEILSFARNPVSYWAHGRIFIRISIKD